MLAWFSLSLLGMQRQVRFFCGDEARFRLKTVSGRKITAKGAKPIGRVQWQFQATYLYGIVEPKTGASVFYEFSHLNTDCFQVFLNLIAQQFADEVIILQLDNGAFHKAKRLQVPDNRVISAAPLSGTQPN
jgi:hypothetical protein